MGERGFILQPTYRIEGGRPVVQIQGVLESGRPFLVRDAREVPHFYILEADEERALALLGTPHGSKALDRRSETRGTVQRDGAGGREGRPATEPSKRTFSGEAVVPIEAAIPADVPPLRDRLLAGGIACYEADVRFALRPLIERHVRGSLEIEGEARDAGYALVFDDPAIGPADWTPRLSVLSFDIETDPTAKRLLSISLWGCGAEEVLLLTPEGWSCPETALPFATERELIQAFCRRVRELDPDVLIGWNVIDFDLAVLVRLAARHGVPFELGRGPGRTRIQAARSVWGSSQASIPGRVVLDGIHLMRGAFIRRDDYSLGSVARDVVGEKKLIEGGDRAGEILRRFKEDRPAFVEYNLSDSRLAYAIVEKLRLVELSVERSRLTGMPIDRVAASIASFDFLYLSELSKRGIVAPSVARAAPGARAPSPAPPGEAPGDEALGEGDAAGDEDRPGERTLVDESRAEDAAPWEATIGGYVLEPVPGLYRNVLVFDFKSLYPSIIRTFQIDPLGFLPAPRPDDDPIVAPNGAAFRRAPGILPRILDDLFPRREAAKRSGDAVTSNAIKILMNSFYGVLGTPACRFYNPDIANAITGFGRELLLWSKARIEARGRQVLYGDTDSLFVLSGIEVSAEATALAEARRLGASLVDELNSDLGAYVRERWRTESRLELEFEELYLRLLLSPVRHGTGGARKRYAGLVERRGENRVIFTGLEAVRRDWTDLAKRVQRELYERLFTDRPVEEYLRDVVAELRAGRLDALLVYRKALRKSTSEYTATTPPHVAAARKMKGKPGRVIAYVITPGGPEPAGEPNLVLDHEHYVQKQIRPVAEPVLAILGLDFDRIVGDDRQLSLF